jgi:hypothetical protein
MDDRKQLLAGSKLVVEYLKTFSCVGYGLLVLSGRNVVCRAVNSETNRTYLSHAAFVYIVLRVVSDSLSASWMV